MNARILSPREEKLKEELVKCGLVPVKADNVTMGNKNNVFMIKDSLLYRIKNTNSYVLFGEPVNYTNILEKLKQSANNPEELKKLFGEGFDLNKKEHKHDDNFGCEEEPKEREIDGETEAVEEEKSEYNTEDVELIMKEAKIGKEEAIEALRKAGDDVIQALCDLNKK